MRTGLGRHRDAVHAGQIDQPEGQFVDHLQRALHRFLRLQRMDVEKPFIRATFSLRRGLCFIVQLPSGNRPRSMA
jgi:hypothetical protein